MADELGGRIFSRTTRKVGLTPFGEHMLPQITGMVRKSGGAHQSCAGIFQFALKARFDWGMSLTMYLLWLKNVVWLRPSVSYSSHMVWICWNIRGMRWVRAPEKNKSTSFLPVVPSPAFHPPAHISICTGGCALLTNPHPAPYGGFINFRDPYPIAQQWASLGIGSTILPQSKITDERKYKAQCRSHHRR